MNKNIPVRDNSRLVGSSNESNHRPSNRVSDNLPPEVLESLENLRNFLAGKEARREYRVK